MTSRFRSLVVLGVPLSLLTLMILVPGCSDSEDTDDTHHEETADECQAILDTCTHDVPGDLAAECHEVGHENDAEACAAREDECVTHCALEGLGGHGGGH